MVQSLIASTAWVLRGEPCLHGGGRRLVGECRRDERRVEVEHQARSLSRMARDEVGGALCLGWHGVGRGAEEGEVDGLARRDCRGQAGRACRGG